MFQQIFDKGDVCRHAPDAELAQGAVHAGDRLLGRLRFRRHLDQKAVIIARDHPARIGGTAVQADPHAGGLTKGGDATIIRNEVVLGIFGGDPSLQRMAVQLHICLRGLARRLGDGLAFGN